MHENELVTKEIDIIKEDIIIKKRKIISEIDLSNKRLKTDNDYSTLSENYEKSKSINDKFRLTF